MRTTSVRLPLGTLSAVTAACLVLSACGGDADGQTDESGELRSVEVAWSTEAAAYVPQSQGPWRFGADFGLAQSEDDITELSSHATAAQLLLSGRAEIATGSFTAFMQTIGQGHDLKMFCPIQGVLTDEVIGIGDVTDIHQLTDADVTVAVDSPGGLIDHVFNHVFEANDMEIVVSDLPNVQILEDGGLRLAALASGEADVAILDPFEIEQLKRQRDDVNTLSLVAEDMDSIGFVYAATSEWLADNQDRATAFCASVLEANKVALADFDTYLEWAEHAMDPAPEPETLKVNWTRANEFGVWPVDAESLSEETFETDLEVAVRAGQITGDASDKTYADVIDFGVAEAAAEMIAD